MFDPILANVAKHIRLTEQEQERFTSLLIHKRIKKKQFLLRENEISRHSAFVVSGCLRGFTVDPNGFEHILQFAPVDWWIADMYSLISGQPGQLNIEAVEDTEVLLLGKQEQEALYREIPKFERFFRIIVENALVASRQRVIDTLSLNARQRYDKFCTIYPTLINRLPQKQIAAFIGVTPEFLSKMRGTTSRKKAV